MYFKECIERIVNTRERVEKEFSELGFTYPTSRANFIFVTHPEYQAKELFEALKEENIYVRYFNSPRISNFLRISIGTDEQMDALIKFLKRYMKRK